MNIEPGSPVQKFLDSEFIRITDPYVPFDEASLYAMPGRLRDSAIIASDIGSGKVVYDTPYARYHYYHPEFRFQGAPVRGAYWADRAMQDGGREQLTREVQAYIRKRGNNG